MFQNSSNDVWLTRRRIKEMREAYKTFISDMEPNVFPTFNVGSTIKPIGGLDRIKGFCAEVESRSLGRNWHKHREPERLKLIGFPERLDSNTHWHAVAYIPPTMVHTLSWNGKAIWQSYAPRGQLDVAWIENEDAVISYMMKHVWGPNSLEFVAIYGPQKH